MYSCSCLRLSMRGVHIWQDTFPLEITCELLNMCVPVRACKSVCMYIYLHMFIYIYIYNCEFVCEFVCVSTYVSACMYTVHIHMIR